jgi:hypothetical protein
VARNGTQTAADAAALAAAREQRDAVGNASLAALLAGDEDALRQLLATVAGDGSPCTAAENYAADNRAEVRSCTPAAGAVGWTVGVRSLGTVGKSVVQGTDEIHATAQATAVVEPRCTLGEMSGDVVDFDCDGGPLDIDPTETDFRLDLSDFYTVHLSD